MSNQGPQPVPLPGVGSFGRPFPGDRPPPVFDHSFRFVPVGLGRRLLAQVLDAIFFAILVVASEVPYVLSHRSLFLLIPPVVGVLLFALALFMVGRRGATPGKKVLRMKIVDHPDGTPIGLGNAFVRQVVLGVLGITLIGYLLDAWSTTRDPMHLKRAWHDLAAGSAVTDLRENAPGIARLEQARARAAAASAYAQAPPPPRAPAPAPEQVYPGTPTPPVRPQPVRPQPVQPQPVQPPPVHEGTRMRPPGPAGGWRLDFDDGQSVAVDGTGLIGRDPEPRVGESVRHPIAITDPGRSLSKTHASFEPTADGALLLTDRHSTNGVSVVRHGAEHVLAAGTPFRLEEGDRVVLGDRQMTVSRA